MMRGSQFGAQSPYRKSTVHEEFDETRIISPRASYVAAAAPLYSSQIVSQPIRSSRISYQVPLATSYVAPLPIRSSRVSYGAPVTTAVTAPRVTRVSYSGPYTTGVRTSVLPERHFLGSYVVPHPVHQSQFGYGSYSSYGYAQPRSSYYGGQFANQGILGNYNSLGRIPRTSFVNY